MPPPSLIARRIFRAMDERGLNKAELARRADFHASYLTLLEKGQIQEPSPARLLQIATVLGLQPSDLIEPPQPGSPDAAVFEAVRAALGPDKVHLFVEAFEAVRELPPNERDAAVDILHALATNWPKRPTRPS